MKPVFRAGNTLREYGKMVSMDSAIMAAQNKYFGFATQEEFDEWDYKRRRDKWEWDKVSAIGHARREGLEIGQKEKAIEIARKMKAMGDSAEKIHAVTGLSFETIEQM